MAMSMPGDSAEKIKSDLSSSERVDLALGTLEGIVVGAESAAIKRAAARDLLEFEGRVGAGASRTKKPEHVIPGEILGVFVSVLAEVREVDRSCSIEGSSLGDASRDSEDKSLLPL